jgi:hypothetical protein
MVSELTIAEQTDLWHHMADLNLRQEKESKPNRIWLWKKSAKGRGTVHQ